MAETGYRHLSRPESNQHHWKYQHNHYTSNTINNNNNNINKLPQRPPRSPVSSSATDTTSEPETSVSGHRRRHYHQHHRQAQMPYGHGHGHQNQSGGHRSGTLRSTRSVPALNVTPWDLSQPVECPVHGHFAPVAQPGGYNMHPMGMGMGHPQMALMPHPQQLQPQPQSGTVLRRAGSMFDMREVYNGPSPQHPHMGPHMGPHMAHYVPFHGLMPQPERKSMYGSMRSLRSIGPHFQGGVHGLQGLPPMPPAHLLPPGVRPRPLVIPVGVEPLPVRDPAKQQASGAPVGPKESKDGKGGPKGSTDCCKGPLPLVWFIISIVTVGVILGVILGSIFG